MANEHPAILRLPIPSFWRVLWCLPNTLIGLAFAALSFGRPEARHGVLLAIAPRGLADRFLTKRGFYAITFGRVIVSTGPVTDDLLAHKFEHVRQFERWGPLFIPLYLWEQVRRGYHANRFEIAAVEAARRFADRRANVDALQDP